VTPSGKHNYDFSAQHFVVRLSEIVWFLKCLVFCKLFSIQPFYWINPHRSNFILWKLP